MKPNAESVVGTTTSTSPSPACSIAAWTMRLSPGAQETVTAVPEIDAPCWIGRIRCPA